jgi:hypothetical protein
MILSNDQKHTFTAFGARAFMRKEETTTEVEEEEITSFFHARAAFLPFLYSCCNELLLELSQKRDFSSGSFCRFATFVSLVSATRLLFRVLLFRLLHPIFSFHQNNNEKRIYYSITISQRRERKREKEKGEKLLNAAFPSHHYRKTSSTKQKRDREIERITHKHRRRELCFVPNSARIFKKKR